MGRWVGRFSLVSNKLGRRSLGKSWRLRLISFFCIGMRNEHISICFYLCMSDGELRGRIPRITSPRASSRKIIQDPF